MVRMLRTWGLPCTAGAIGGVACSLAGSVPASVGADVLDWCRLPPDLCLLIKLGDTAKGWPEIAVFNLIQWGLDAAYPALASALVALAVVSRVSARENGICLLCQSCGQPLAGSNLPRCPECGQVRLLQARSRLTLTTAENVAAVSSRISLMREYRPSRKLGRRCLFRWVLPVVVSVAAAAAWNECMYCYNSWADYQMTLVCPSAPSQLDRGTIYPASATDLAMCPSPEILSYLVCEMGFFCCLCSLLAVGIRRLFYRLPQGKSVTCGRCGYSLRGLPAPKCSRCGATGVIP